MTKLVRLDQYLNDIQQTLTKLKENLQRAQHRMKQQADKGCSDKHYSVGDWVWVELHSYRQQSVSRRTCPKLAKRFFGPYKIVEQVGVVAYKLELPVTACIHPVFHVSLLKNTKEAC